MLLLAAAPLAARDSLGVYDGWAAFRDASPARCYAIAKAEGNSAVGAYATISTWPGKGVRGAVHIVLSHEVSPKATVRLAVGDKRFTLVTKGRNAWAADPREDAAIIAAIRSAARMSVSGGGFTDRYTLTGAATAIDAATVGCAKR
jgi:hypothetical protein